MNKTIYEFKAKDITGAEIDLAQYKGSTVLIVNTASKCGFTNQYDGLEAIYEKLKDKNFVVLGFPCNQFGGQEPAEEAEIAQFCEMKFNIKFPMFSKVDVNGDTAHPLFNFLKKQSPGLLGSEKIKWNFTKFLINKEGIPVERYAPTTKPEDIEKDILKIL